MNGYYLWSPTATEYTHCPKCGGCLFKATTHRCHGGYTCYDCCAWIKDGFSHLCHGSRAYAPAVSNPKPHSIKERIADIEQRGEHIESMLTRLCEVFLED